MTSWNDSVLTRDEIRNKKREALVKQAALEFRKRGYHATSMGDIASALGVTKGALYRYVKSKDEVLYECFMHSNEIADQALERVKDMEASSAEKLASFMTEFIQKYLESNLAGGAMIEIDALLPEQRKKVVGGRDKVDRALRCILDGGVADGSILDESPKLMIFSFMGTINWIPSWFSPDGELTTTEIAEHITHILMHGIRSRPAEGAARPTTSEREFDSAS
jgi:TetR/AcrR family transcriptional regulator